MLAAVEKRFDGEPFVVIGVHSPKFPNERDAEMVREAVRRYGVTHPVVVDSDHAIWQRYGVRAWPTLALIDAEGYVVASGSGEPSKERLIQAVEQTIADARRRGVASDRRLPLRPEPAPPGSLSYPGKVIAADGRLFVADTGHHQIVVARAGGEEEFRIGTGTPGFADGQFGDCGLNHPQGMALAGDVLYVADTGNHAVRAADLREGTLRTVAGTGRMAEGMRMGRGPGLETDLRSPWDLAWDGARLYVAMAGMHQIWVFDPGDVHVAPFAGTGYETRIDGPVADAAFAQPSGLALADGVLYVADSEISSVRAIEDLAGAPSVRTVCGSGDLFGFGDRDGAGEDVLLQHPIGITAADGVLYLADTYNHKVKRIDPATGRCETLFGDTEPERLPEVIPGRELKAAAQGTPAFFEPEGIAVRDGELLIADTNNHRVLAVRLADGARRALLGG